MQKTILGLFNSVSFLLSFPLLSLSFGMDAAESMNRPGVNLQKVEELRLACHRYCDDLRESFPNCKREGKETFLSFRQEVYSNSLSLRSDTFVLHDCFESVVSMLLFSASGDSKVLEALHFYNVNDVNFYGREEGETMNCCQHDNFRGLLAPLNTAVLNGPEDVFSYPNQYNVVSEYLQILEELSSSQEILDRKIILPPLEMFLFLVQELGKNPEIWCHPPIADFIFTLQGNLINLATCFCVELPFNLKKSFRDEYNLEDFKKGFQDDHLLISFVVLYQQGIPFEIMGLILNRICFLDDVKIKLSWFRHVAHTTHHRLANETAKLLSPEEIIHYLTESKDVQEEIECEDVQEEGKKEKKKRKGVRQFIKDKRDQFFKKK